MVWCEYSEIIRKLLGKSLCWSHFINIRVFFYITVTNSTRFKISVSFVSVHRFIKIYIYIYKMFDNIPRNVRLHSPECLTTCPELFGCIPRNVWQHSPECLTIFPGMFGYIPRNVWRYSPECWKTFLGMFEYIPPNVWRHSPEYNIPPIPRVPRIPFLAPLFLVLYIALLLQIVYSYGVNPANSYFYSHERKFISNIIRLYYSYIHMQLWTSGLKILFWNHLFVRWMLELSLGVHFKPFTCRTLNLQIRLFWA